MAATQQDLSSAPTPVVNGPVRHAATWPLELYRSAVGKKWVMALTGVVLLLFVFGHMIGNLKIYLGAEELDHYGEFLREILVPLVPRTVTLWIVRIGDWHSTWVSWLPNGKHFGGTSTFKSRCVVHASVHRRWT